MESMLRIVSRPDALAMPTRAHERKLRRCPSFASPSSSSVRIDSNGSTASLLHSSSVDKLRSERFMFQTDRAWVARG